MRNRYFILDDFIISDQLRTCILGVSQDQFRYYGTRRKRLYMHSINLETIPELQEVLDKLYNPSIVDNFEIMFTEPGATVMPHVDSRRRVALNIPIAGDFKNSFIGIYEKGKRFVPNVEFFDNKPLVKDGGGYPDSKLLQKVSYTTPICLNTEEVHNVVNHSKEMRVVLGLGFATNLSFSDIQKLHDEDKFINAKDHISK